MKKFFLLILLISSGNLFAQSEQKLCEAFLQSVKEKKFTWLKPWLGPNEKAIKEKWQKVVDQAHRKDFDINTVKISSTITGKQLPNMPMRSIIAVYKYDGAEWDDLLLMVTTGDQVKLADIPLTSYMFTLSEDRWGKNIADSKKN